MNRGSSSFGLAKYGVGSGTPPPTARGLLLAGSYEEGQRLLSPRNLETQQPGASPFGGTPDAGSYNWRNQEDVEGITNISDDTERNHAITADYYKKSNQMRDVLGYEPAEEADASWLTFAVWASSEAGRVIRGENMPSGKEVEQALRGAIKIPWLPMGAGKVFEKTAGVILDKVQDAIAKGNQEVYSEIAAAFGAFINMARGDKVPDLKKRQSFLDTFPYGPSLVREPSGIGSMGGKSLLAQAFSMYYDAIFARGDKKSELVFGANVLIGVHEQTQIQYYVDRAMGGWIDDFNFSVLQWGPDPLSWPRFLPDLDDLLPPVVRKVVSWVATKAMMNLGTPGASLDLSDDVPTVGDNEFPADLKTLSNANASGVVDRWDENPDTLKGSAAGNWADLSDRMNYIVDLFRSRQKDQRLYENPRNEAPEANDFLCEIDSGGAENKSTPESGGHGMGIGMGIAPLFDLLGDKLKFW